MQNHSSYAWALVINFCLILGVAGEGQAVLDPSERRCAAAVDRGVTKIARSEDRLLLKCLRAAANNGLLVTLEECWLAKHTKVSAVSEKAAVTHAAACGATLPDFGASDAVTMTNAAVETGRAWVRDLFGSNLDVARLSKAEDPVGSRCQYEVAKQVSKCRQTQLSAFHRCKSAGIAGRRGPAGASLPFESEEDLVRCVGEDFNGRIAKQCGSKLQQVITAKCSAVSLEQAFPGCGVESASELVECAAGFSSCSSCIGIEQANQVIGRCDNYDDDVLNGSCGSNLCEGLNSAECLLPYPSSFF